jgi:RNA-directed DNA polymerase
MKALSIFIEPAFSKFNSHCSYAFIKGRGVNKAIERIHQLVAEGNKYYFEADIINFFGSVDRSALWSMFSGQVKHRSLHPILKQCFNLELEDLKSYDTAFQELFLGSDSGVPQGGVLSPMLANFYLYHFDRKMLENHFNLVRYADDFVVMCKTEEEAQRAHDFSKNILRSLNLQIHELEAPNSKTRIGNFSKDGLSFLGVRFEGPHTFPTKKSITRFEKKVEEVLKPETGESLFKTLQKLANLINGWGKCYRSMRVLEIYLRLDDFIKRRVEDYLDREGVRLLGKKRGRQMKFLGVPSLTAMIQHSPRAKATSAGE